MEGGGGGGGGLIKNSGTVRDFFVKLFVKFFPTCIGEIWKSK